MAFRVTQAILLSLWFTLISAVANPDLRKCDDNHFVESSTLANAMERCKNATCFTQCWSTVVGWLKKDARLIKDKITMACSLKSSSIRKLHTAHKYAKGFFRAHCNRLLANVNDCKSYDYFYACALHAGCYYALYSHSADLTEYSDTKFWMEHKIFAKH